MSFHILHVLQRGATLAKESEFAEFFFAEAHRESEHAGQGTQVSG
jgi:hypothetical protein